MAQSWTFGKKIGAGFAAVVVLLLLISAIGAYGLNSVVRSKDRVIDVYAENLFHVQRLHAAAEWKASAVRAYLLVPEEQQLEMMRASRTEVLAEIQALQAETVTPEGRRLVDEIQRVEAANQETMEQVIVARQEGATAESAGRAFQELGLPQLEELRQLVASFIELQENLLEDQKQAATDTASAASVTVAFFTVVALLLALLIAFLLTRGLSRQIGTAVQHVQSSSTELQAAANQQATGAREQATAMTEINTTITELLATSKQIAESAQRVAHIAEETAHAARSGEATVATTSESLDGIKRQVDLIVTHMLELGRKSQQIGGILEIINELAVQTNILAINATVEAVGAGDSGKRFGVVADEIRKLADRVAGSTKEIRSLIDEIRAAVNSTVMTTEGGTKIVDAGARQFTEVAEAFIQISSLVNATTDAAREIELSTKQQTTAVEQVNLAVADVAQTTRETEASSGETFQTASQLTELSRDLMRLIQRQRSA